MGQNFKFAPNLKGWFGILALTQHFLIKIKKISKKETYAASHFKKLHFWAFFTILPDSPSKPPNTAIKQFYPLFNFSQIIINFKNISTAELFCTFTFTTLMFGLFTTQFKFLEIPAMPLVTFPARVHAHHRAPRALCAAAPGHRLPPRQSWPWPASWRMPGANSWASPCSLHRCRRTCSS